MGTEISADVTMTRHFCLETVMKLIDSCSLNGMPDTISGAFRLRLGIDIFRPSQRRSNRWGPEWTHC